MRRLATALAGLSAEDDDDGQEAVHAAVVASEKSSEKWTSMLLDKLKSCRDEAERSWLWSKQSVVSLKETQGY